MTIPPPDLAISPSRDPASFDLLEARIDEIAGDGTVDGHRPMGPTPVETVSELLTLGEKVLERWIEARGEIPTQDSKEGFRLLALHRQGARGEPSFNACRETCRELVYHYNLVAQAPVHPETGRRVVLAGLVTRHLLLFVSGKMEVEGLGQFCCSSEPLRTAGG